jgi:hypothetical protein
MIDKKQLSKMMLEMAAVGAKYGYKVTPNGGSLGTGLTDAKIKFNVLTMVTSGEGKAAVAVSGRATQEAKFAGIDITKSFKDSKGKTHRVIDYRPRAYKSPWVTEASDGKTYIWSPTALKSAMSPLMAAAKTSGVDGLSHLL